jgi:hypothetical protein
MMKGHFLPYQGQCLPVVPQQDSYALISKNRIQCHETVQYMFTPIRGGVLTGVISIVGILIKVLQYRIYSQTRGCPILLNPHSRFL